MCQNLKDAMENEECECDKAPEAFTSDTFCDDKAKDFHEKYKKDPFEAKMARACTMGCDGCCKHNKEDFLQVKNATLATVKAHTDSRAPKSQNNAIRAWPPRSSSEFGPTVSCIV